jgi:DNA-binding LacI/PurR family transcriptional regulator
MTVSNAYNRPDQLSAELRTRVLEAAARLGYAGPDPIARGLRSGRTGAVGVLYDSWPSFVFQDPSAVAFLEGLSGAIERAVLGLLLIPGPWPDRGEARPIDTALVDGFVTYSVADTDPQVTEALSRRPVVIVDQPRLDGVPFVGIDDQASAAAAAHHLIALGHRRIAVISFALAHDGTAGPATLERQGAATYAVTRARLSGYRTALREAGIAWERIRVFECPGSAARLGRVAARQLIASDPDVTAVLAMSDALAIGAVQAARDHGLKVPDDLSIVGFDDAPSASASTPPLTTIRQPNRDKGRRAGTLLRELLDGRPTATTNLLSAELIVRASTGPPRANHRSPNPR